MQEKNISPNNFEQCIKCTICTVYCPLVPVNPAFPGPKQAGPDGERLRLKNPFFYDDALKYCMNCKRCEVACPSGVHIADIIHSARASYSKKSPSLRDMILASTDFMGKAARPFAPVVNMVTASSPAKYIMDKVLGIDKNRTFPKYQSQGFVSWFKENREGRQNMFRDKLALFHGCSTEFQHPEVGKAFVEVINALGYGIKLLDEKCCAVAMISNGMWKAAAKNARHNVKVFEKAVDEDMKVVTLTTTCTFTMRDEYPAILKVDNSKVKESIVLAEKFIYELIESGKVKLVFKKGYKARSAYHVPCHMEKLGWSIFTKRLMEMIPGMELLPLDSNCCGIAGTYGFKKENYQYSQAIGEPLFKQIKALDPDFVTCECETCKWQIEMSTAYKVLNPIQILAEALDIEATAKANAGSEK